MFGALYRSVDGRTEYKMSGRAFETPIKDVMHRQIRCTRPASPPRRIAAAEPVCAGPPSSSIRTMTTTGCSSKTTNPEGDVNDVAHPDAWRDDRLVLNLAECPGERRLILGTTTATVPALRRGRWVSSSIAAGGRGAQDRARIYAPHAGSKSAWSPLDGHEMAESTGCSFAS